MDELEVYEKLYGKLIWHVPHYRKRVEAQYNLVEKPKEGSR